MFRCTRPQAPAETLPPPPEGSAIRRCPGGVSRWTCELSMYRNPAILFTAWKVMALSFGIVWLFAAMLALCEDGFDAMAQLKLAGGFLLRFSVVGIGIGGISCLILAALHGGRYCVVFEMNGQGVRHSQMPRHFKKARLIGAIAALAGAARGSFPAAGAGMLAASRSEMYTEFAKVKSARAARSRSAIYLGGLLHRNQIYAGPQDFGFVLGFIRSRVPAEAAARLQA